MPKQLSSLIDHRTKSYFKRMFLITFSTGRILHFAVFDGAFLVLASAKKAQTVRTPVRLAPRCSRIPTGFKNLWSENNEVIALTNQKGGVISRLSFAKLAEKVFIDYLCAFCLKYCT